MGSLNLFKRPATIGIVLRALTIGIRFFAVLMITKRLGLQSAGLYALAQALIGPAPAVFGAGIVYMLTREMPGRSEIENLLTLRDRFYFDIIIGIFFIIIATVVGGIAGFVQNKIYWPVVVLIAAELIGGDICMLLIGMGRIQLSNILLFLRSALWVPLAIGIVYLIGHEEGMGFYMMTWAVMAIVWPAVIIILLFWNNLRGLLRLPDFKHQLQVARRGKAVYLNEVVNALRQNLDRYLAGVTLGLADLGVYSFFSSFSGAAILLINSGPLQAGLPELIVGVSGDGAHRAVNKYIRAAMVVGFPILVGASSMSVLAAMVTHRDGLIMKVWAVPILALIQGVALMSQALNYVLYAWRQDKFLVISNIIAVIASALIMIFMSRVFSFVGFCVANLIGVTGLALARLFKVNGLQRNIKRAPAQSVVL